ncbi:MAG: hypothetical protein RLY27_2122 [Pseudomonadota bacterium]|jgi:uncharacterized protein
MSQKPCSTQILHASEAALRQVDFKSGQTYQGEGFFSLQHFPRILSEIWSGSVEEVTKESPEQAGIDWQVVTWLDDTAAGHTDYRLRVRIRTALHLECQRCLEGFLQKIDISAQFVLLESHQEVEDFPIDNFDEDALLQSDAFDLMELIEDEVLLALPLVPKHPQGECALLKSSTGALVEADDKSKIAPIESEKGHKNPFLGLKKLKLDS